jgi:hypothetical protein
MGFVLKKEMNMDQELKQPETYDISLEGQTFLDEVYGNQPQIEGA